MKHIWGGGGEKILPNVSLIEETNKVEYNPYIPPQPITYTASEKLVETTSQYQSGLHTNAFNTTIKSHTFENGVGTIEFNDYVTSIGNFAFAHCTSLTSVTIPSSVTSIGNQAFNDCGSLTSINIPNSVTSIGENAFRYCTSLPVVDNIRYADTCAIDATDRNLLTYTIKEGTRFIVHAFQNCTKLTSITIPNSVTSIGECAFDSCRSLTSITIPNSVTSIGDGAFAGCRSLTSITIPNSVTSIGIQAFNSCTNLTSVTIPNSVTSIGEYAFYNCTKLTSVTIGNSVTSIGYQAFNGCSSLTSVTVETTTPPTLESGAFASNASGRKIYVPSESVDTYKTASGWSNYADDIAEISE